MGCHAYRNENSIALVGVENFGVWVSELRGAVHTIVNYCSRNGAPLRLGLS
jgi:hypothetical protein